MAETGIHPLSDRAFGIYVHIPFCVHRCSYCDFYTLTNTPGGVVEAYLQKLTQEIEQASTWLKDQEGVLPMVTSVFLGGGTPSLVPVKLLSRLFARIQQGFPLDANSEITMEANPETVSLGYLQELRDSTPVNRISLGAQSFQEAHLQTLERLAKREAIERAAGDLIESRFTNFNLDLIFAIPGQTADTLSQDIKSATSLGPQHISFYNLTLKPGHKLFMQLPTEETQAEFYEQGVDALESLGYFRYEISNFGREGKQSRHNLLYWQGSDYLGVGPSAASRFFRQGRFVHRKQAPDLGKYLAQQQFTFDDFEVTSWEQTVLEAAFLELRKASGVRIAHFRSRYGYDLAGARRYPLFLKHKLIEEWEGGFRLTPKGMLLADRVTSDLVDLTIHKRP